jgi:hypothetical protein
MQSANTLLSQAKLILQGEVRDLTEDLAHANSELLEAHAWHEEMRSVLQEKQETSEILALQQDIEDLANYEADLQREVKLINRRLLNRRSFALNLKAQAKKLKSSASSTPLESKRTRIESPAKEPIQPVSVQSKSPTCIRCNAAAAEFGGRKRHLYCKSCKPKSLGGSLFGDLKRRRQALEFSITTKWPERFVGMALQGGAPGLGKKA